MDLPILLVGAPDFLSEMAERYPQLQPKTLLLTESRAFFAEIQAEKPDILILPYEFQTQEQLCRQMRSYKSLRGTYCIAIDRVSPAMMQQATLMMMRSANALEAGVDAYVSLQNRPTETLQPAIEDRIFWATLQTAQKRVKYHQELIRTNDALSTIALADPLTQLSNRRALEWELPRQINKAETSGNPFSLIILDVDFFKNVNDIHGHLIGDQVLRLLATRLQNFLRQTDRAFRYGGEEFVILLKNTDLTRAENLAQQLRRIVSEHPFQVDRTLSLPITVSLGVSSLRSGDDPQGICLLHRADQHLLTAKSRGRDQVVSDRTHPDV